MNPIDAEYGRRLRSRARLLEFLKFRVLASQETFFEAWRVEPIRSCETPTPTALADEPQRFDPLSFRRWLQPLWPEAAGLSDADLCDCLAQAHRLYVDPQPRGGR